MSSLRRKQRVLTPSLVSLCLLSCWTADIAAVRPMAADALRCEPEEVRVSVRSGKVAWAKGCQRQAAFLRDPQTGGWELESVYPTDAAGYAYVPACIEGEYYRFVADAGDEPATVVQEGDVTDGGIVPPKMIAHGTPSYPPEALRRSAEADVVVRCQLDTVGLLECCDLSTSNDAPGFERVVRRELAARRFDPALKNRQPLPVTYVWKFRFIID
jgi:TonB family protein